MTKSPRTGSERQIRSTSGRGGVLGEDGQPDKARPKDFSLTVAEDKSGTAKREKNWRSRAVPLKCRSTKRRLRDTGRSGKEKVATARRAATRSRF